MCNEIKIDLDNDRLVNVRDSSEKVFYGAFLLNNKHSINDFQNAIYEARNKHEEEIEENGDDWVYIFGDKLFENFDYIELSVDEDYLVI